MILYKYNIKQNIFIYYHLFFELTNGTKLKYLMLESIKKCNKRSTIFNIQTL